MRTPISRRGARPARARPAPRGRACPLPLWRTLDPSDITEEDVTALARAVAATAILHERRWPAARAGDPATAAAVAIDRIHRHEPEGPVFDVVMGNLVVIARRRGDQTARVVLAHALRSLARRHPRRPDLRRIAERWAGPSRTGSPRIPSRTRP
ncbi:hypothetical protein [Methylobacterium pseudosasicola]|uniref:Uncharacterized protein n=1 Tax=Methylobacterium pseudosasicola TaxID=582667 RepID=A0A1I4PY47_9HYPH|nr:hypothetical protein [Methylobacterium pseudosasicola]SFM32751.1 hypothetical protein SAMN05192568_102727 [Methylobacterium pseudosasicola]